jgi:hypothetical protein
VSDEFKPKIVDMALCVPPRGLREGVELLATFTLVMWPIRARGLRLVRDRGELNVVAPTSDLKFMADARPIIIEAAKAQARNGIEEMGGA